MSEGSSVTTEVQGVSESKVTVSHYSAPVCGCYSSGIMAGTELTLLTPHTGSIYAPGANFLNVQNQTRVPEREMGVGGRYWFGYRNESGLGVRTRYWHFNRLDVGGQQNLDSNLDAQTWDE